MITQNPSKSNGSAAAITAPVTELKMHVAMPTTRHLLRAPAHRVFFRWEHCTVQAVLVRKTVGGTALNPRREWSFMTTGLQTPYFHREHDLPMTAMFVLEVHRRLTAAVRARVKIDFDALLQ